MLLFLFVFMLMPYREVFVFANDLGEIVSGDAIKAASAAASAAASEAAAASAAASIVAKNAAEKDTLKIAITGTPSIGSNVGAIVLSVGGSALSTTTHHDDSISTTEHH